MHELAKKRIKAHLLDLDDDVDGFLKGCALIRSNLHVEPCTPETTEDEFAELYGEALWLEQWRLKNLAELAKNLLSGKE